MYHRLGDLTTEISFTQFWRLGNLKSRYQPLGFPSEGPLLGVQTVASHCVLTRQGEEDSGLSGVSP